jgi:DNA-binding LacI/PurR family transcriptional regulator
LDDVAKAVGVSRATVSNAYNRPDQLSAELREEVLRQAKQLGYTGPNPSARSLATNRTGVVAFMLDAGLSVAFSDPALSITLDALAAEVDSAGHSLLLLPGGQDGGPRADRVLAAQADIAVAYSLADGASAIQAVKDRGLPLVVIDQPETPDSALVRLDDRGGAAAAARHLLDLGHRRFGILSAQCFSVQNTAVQNTAVQNTAVQNTAVPRCGPLSAAEATSSRYRVNRERLAGYLGTLAAAGIAADQVSIWETADFSREHAMASARGLLEAGDLTAILCMSDELAMATLSVAKQLGLSVPGDLSVVGFDDTAGARWADPPLTTIRQDLTGKGRLAGKLTLSLLAGHPLPAPAILDVELIVRQSTARAAT